MDRIRVMGGKSKPRITEDVHDNAAHGRSQQQNREVPIPEIGLLVYLLLLSDTTNQDIAGAEDQKRGGEIAYPSLGMVQRVNLVGLKPAQKEDHHHEHCHAPDAEEKMLRPAHFLGRALHHLSVCKKVEHEDLPFEEPLGNG